MVPLPYYLVLSGILFACGVTGHHTLRGRDDNKATTTLNNRDFLGVHVVAAAGLAQADDFSDTGVFSHVIDGDCELFADGVFADFDGLYEVVIFQKTGDRFFHL